MKLGSAGRHLHLVCIETGRSVVQSEKAHTTAWMGAVLSLVDREVHEHGIHSEQWWQDERATLIKTLRARVKSGSYRVDSMALAECILQDEFFPL